MGNVYSYKFLLKLFFTKESNMRYFGRLKNVFAFAAVLILGGALVGCNIEEASKAANTNPEELKPKGTLILSYVDISTGEPIVGVLVDIGIKTARTNDRGIATFKNIPATTDASSSSDVTGEYIAVADFSKVTSPIKMRDRNITVKYPLTHLEDNIRVEYATLEDASTSPSDPNNVNTDADTVTNASNHDTPVTGLVASKEVKVGKLSTSVSGEIRDKKTNALVTEAYIVKLWTGTGQTTLIQSLSTSNGVFNFTKVQAGTTINVTAENAINTMRGLSGGFTSAEDGRSISLAVEGQDGPILVSSVDGANPRVTSISISDGTNIVENGADIGAVTTDVTVIFSFSEDLLADGYSTGLMPTKAKELWDDVVVNFDGNKAGDVAHTINWDSAGTMTSLEVNIPNVAASSLYSVDIKFGTELMDPQDQALDFGGSVGYDDADSSNTVNAGDLITASFSTGGGTTVTTPVVTVTNSSVLDYNVMPKLDWPVVSGAKSYNVYRSTLNGTVVVDAMRLVGNVARSDYTESVASADDITSPGTGLPFNSAHDQGTSHGEEAQTYDYYVRAVNSDGDESANSVKATASDSVGASLPNLAGQTAGWTDPGDGNTASNTLSIGLGQPMDKDSVENTANWVFAASGSGGADTIIPTATNASYNPANFTVTLTVNIVNTAASGTDVYDGFWTLTFSGTDLSGNIPVTAADQFNNETSAIE